MNCVNPAELDFETLNAASHGFDTFTYWLAVLSDPHAKLARDAEEACAAMSYQYDAEEQVSDVPHLRRSTPAVLRPVAPVTLAWRWSPFPAACSALGEPIHSAIARSGKVVTVFRPVAAPSFSSSSADERHFLFLLRHCCERACGAKQWAFLCGSPGWSYKHDFLPEFPRVRRVMARFGFVYRARKPQDG